MRRRLPSRRERSRASHDVMRCALARPSPTVVRRTAARAGRLRTIDAARRPLGPLLRMRMRTRRIGGIDRFRRLARLHRRACFSSTVPPVRLFLFRLCAPFSSRLSARADPRADFRVRHAPHARAADRRHQRTVRAGPRGACSSPIFGRRPSRAGFRRGSLCSRWIASGCIPPTVCSTGSCTAACPRVSHRIICRWSRGSRGSIMDSSR